MKKYTIKENGYVDLSNEEKNQRTFDAEKLSQTLGISIEDALLLNSEGKTYVFAKSTDGNIYELYHPDLSVNRLNIHVEIATKERIAQFNHKEWSAAPFSKLLGQTDNENHFVC